MVKYLISIIFISTFANATEQVCEGNVKAVERQFRTIQDMIIVMEQPDVQMEHVYPVRFIKEPNKWDLISKWVQVPKHSQITINSIALRKEQCKIPHHDKWLTCWIKTTYATYQNDGDKYNFKVSDVPESEYLGCKSPNEFYNWLE